MFTAVLILLPRIMIGLSKTVACVIIIIFIAGFHDMNYVYRSHKGPLQGIKDNASALLIAE